MMANNTHSPMPDEAYLRLVSTLSSPPTSPNTAVSTPSFELLFILPSGKLLHYQALLRPSRPLPPLLTFSAALSAFVAVSNKNVQTKSKNCKGEALVASAKGRVCLVQQIDANGLILVLIAHTPKMQDASSFVVGKNGTPRKGEVGGAIQKKESFEFPSSFLRHLLHVAVDLLRLVFTPLWKQRNGWPGRSVSLFLEKGFASIFSTMVDRIVRDVVGSVMHVVRSLPAPAEPKIRAEVDRAAQMALDHGEADIGFVVIVAGDCREILGGAGRFKLLAGELEVILAMADGESDSAGDKRDLGIYLRNGGGWRWSARKKEVELRVESRMFERFRKTVGDQWRPKGGTKIEVVVVVKGSRKPENEVEVRVTRLVEELDGKLERLGAASELVAAMERRWRVSDIVQNFGVKWVAVFDSELGMMTTTCEWHPDFGTSCAILKAFERFAGGKLSKKNRVWNTSGMSGEMVLGYDRFLVAIFEDSVQIATGKLVVTHILVPWAKRFMRAIIPDSNLRYSYTERINSCLLDRSANP